MADVDDYPLGFLPPMKFDPFNNRLLGRKGGAGGSPTLTWKTGYPYDLMEDLPPLGAQYTTSARGGAVKYIDSSYPGSFPEIDRYYAFVAKEEEVSLWGYVKQAAEWNWKVVIPFDGKEVEHSMFDAANSLYLGTVIKDNGKESSLFGYSDSGKRNYKVIADDEKASLEAWEVEGSEQKYIIASTKDWPENVAGNTKNKRLVLASESYKDTKPELVKLRELELDLPKGCPFDLTFAINEESNSAVGAVKHTGCITVDGEKVGNGVFERYAAANADMQKTGFTAYFDTAQDGYLDASTKGQAETFVWGYCDQGESNFRARVFGYDGKLEAYHTNNQEYASLYYTSTDSGVYGFHDTNGKYWRLYATNTRPELQLWHGDGRAWASVHAQPAESAFYGWCDTEQSLCRMRAIPFKGQVELWRSDGMNYALMEQKPGETSFYSYSNDQAFNFKAVTTPGNQDKAEVLVWSQGNDGFASMGTKGQEESYFWAYADQGQANVRMRGFGADWGIEGWNTQLEKSLYLKSEDFPSTTSSLTPVRLVAASERYKSGGKPTIVKLRELPDLAPRGCPYDIIAHIQEDSNSASGAVKHTGCITVDGEKQGNNVYERYAAAKADAQKTGFTTYFGTAQEGYLDASTKGQGETFVYGYADQSTSAFRIRAIGADQSLELWSTARDCIIKAETITTQSVVYGRFDGNYQFSLKANATQSNLAIFDAENRSYGDVKVNVTESSYYGYADDGTASHRIRSMAFKSEVELWKDDGSAYGLMRVEPFRSSVWLNSDGEVYNVRIAADEGADSSYCRVYGQSNNVFASLHTEEGKASAWGYALSGSNLFTNEANSTEVFWRGQLNTSFVGISVKSPTADIWGYTSGVCQWKSEASASQAKCQTFNSSGWAQISAISSKVSFDASLNNDFSYLTQNTLRLEYANGDTLTGNPGTFFVNYTSGAYSNLYGGGLYLNDGSNFVQINPPSGKDAYFQQVEVCVDGQIKKAYVLMTEIFD